MRTEEFNKLSEEERKKALGFLHGIERIFSTDDGKKVLEHWVKKYVMTPYSNPNLSNDERMYNAGRAALILEIKESIELSKKVR